MTVPRPEGVKRLLTLGTEATMNQPEKPILPYLDRLAKAQAAVAALKQKEIKS